MIELKKADGDLSLAFNSAAQSNERQEVIMLQVEAWFVDLEREKDGTIEIATIMPLVVEFLKEEFSIEPAEGLL